MTDSDIVKAIIDEELLIEGKVSKFYVVEEIKNRIHTTHLLNKCLSNGEDRSDSASSDGIKNINIGANKIFRDSIRSLKNHFHLREDGYIFSKQSDKSFKKKTKPKTKTKAKELSETNSSILEIIKKSPITRDQLAKKVIAHFDESVFYKKYDSLKKTKDKSLLKKGKKPSDKIVSLSQKASWAVSVIITEAIKVLKSRNDIEEVWNENKEKKFIAIV
jgi:hypothetical protein